MKKMQGNKKSLTQAQRIGLALAFIGEHKELFEEWLKSKGMHAEVETDDV